MFKNYFSNYRNKPQIQMAHPEKNATGKNKVNRNLTACTLLHFLLLFLSYLTRQSSLFTQILRPVIVHTKSILIYGPVRLETDTRSRTVVKRSFGTTFFLRSRFTEEEQSIRGRLSKKKDVCAVSVVH